jgi:hypothetical protein
MMHFCTIGRGSGGGGLLQYWQVGVLLGQKLDFCFLGLVFEEAGRALKKKGDDKTTNPFVVKFRVDPNYLVVV